MTNTNNATTAVQGGKPAGQVRFSSYNRPAVDDGLYEITITHQFQADDAMSDAVTVPSLTKYFAALGPRFTLDPSEVSMQFPPPKTSGRYYDILPHIMFTRAILPWERRCDPTQPNMPWLALVMVTQTEIDAWRAAANMPDLLSLRTGALNTVIQDARTNKIVFPETIDLEPGESSSLSFNYIDIPEPLLQQILPSQDELALLSSVRQSADGPDSGSANPKFPTLICNRLPQPNQENTVFLLSLENRGDVYASLSGAPALTGAPTPSPKPKLYRFAVLSSWRFASVTPNLTFTQLLSDANKYAQPTLGVFRLASVNVPAADQFLEKGYVPLEHQTRQGNRMVSWYRGPLLPGTAAAPPAPAIIQSPDALIQVFADVGMFDVSYAAAWNLGRSLILRDKRISLALFHWKRASAQAHRAQVPRHLPGAAIPPAPPLPDVVADWFTRLGRLEQVPFNYLVPDATLLPPESIQFFSVDPAWVQQLICGAFAVGDIASSDSAIEASLFGQLPEPVSLSGFLLRSKVVSGWPHMEIAGYDAEPAANTTPPFMPSDATPLPLHRYALGTETLLCLFEGAIESVELFQHPESIHFGIDYQAPDTGIPEPCFIKRLRDANGDLQPFPDDQCGANRATTYETKQWVRIPFRPCAPGVVDIATLASYFAEALPISAVTPAEFAYQMVAGVPKMRFTRQN